ncbi:MAG: hypothetical protein WCJ03_07160 [Bacteroidales bacterium]
MPLVIDDLLLMYAANAAIQLITKPVGSWLDSKANGDEKRKEAIAFKDYQHELDLKMLYRTREIDHASKVQLQQESFKQRLAEAEYQYEQFKKKSFDQRVWPLKTPYEDFSLQPLTISGNSQQSSIIPCRVFITKTNRNTDYVRYDLEGTINTQLSMFLEKGYELTGEHPFISHIGDWRDGDLQEDVFIKSLWDGLQGQPVIVLNPCLLNNGDTLSLRVSFWGLGACGSQAYPITKTLLSMDIAVMRGTLLREESKRLLPLGLPNISSELKFNFELLDAEARASDSTRDKLIEANFRRYRAACEVVTNVDKEITKGIGAALSCFTGLYADIYHLIEYGTAPIMPMRMNQETLDFALSVDLAAFYRGVLATLAATGYHGDKMKSIYLDTAASLLHTQGYENIAETIAKEGLCLWLAEKDANCLPQQVDVDWQEYIDNICKLSSKLDSRDQLFIEQVTEILQRTNNEIVAQELIRIDISKDTKIIPTHQQLINQSTQTKTATKYSKQNSIWDLNKPNSTWDLH